MLVICNSCSTRFNVPDEKVAGRRAKMKCRKCGAVVAIDGTQLAPPSAPAASEVPLPPEQVRRPPSRPTAAAPPPTPARAESLSFNDETKALSPEEAASLKELASQTEVAIPEPFDERTPVRSAFEEPAPNSFFDEDDVEAAMRSFETVYEAPRESGPARNRKPGTAPATPLGEEPLSAASLLTRPSQIPPPTAPRSSPSAAPPPPSSRPRSATPPSGPSSAPRPSSGPPRPPSVAPRPASSSPASLSPASSSPASLSPVASNAGAFSPASPSSVPPRPPTPPTPGGLGRSHPPSAPPLELPTFPRAFEAPSPHAFSTAARAPRSKAPFVVAFLLLILVGLGAVALLRPDLLRSVGVRLGAGFGPPPAPVLDEPAAHGALAKHAAEAFACAEAGGPSGPGRVNVLFETNGRARSATVSPPFTETAVGRCLVRHFEMLTLPAFSGPPVVLQTTFEVPSELR